MSQIRLCVAALIIFLALATLLSSTAQSGGGQIQGKVTDPLGASVAGALITISDPISNLSFTNRTNEQGLYKIGELPAGIYSVTASASGFDDAHRDSVDLEEGAVVTVDLKLEIAPIEAAVAVSASVKSNSDVVYQKLRQLGKHKQDFAGSFATVSNLVLKRDAAVFTLRSGEIYFGAIIEGRTTAAVFIGDGELTLVPPTPIEKHSLSNFIHEEKLVETFSHLVIRLTDKTFDEIKSSPAAAMATNGPQAGKARDLYRDNQYLLRKELRDNGEMRTLADIYAPERPGYFNAFIIGEKHHKLVFLLDPLGIPRVSPEEVALSSYSYTDEGTWTAFHLAREYANGTASSSEDHRLYDITHHQLDIVIKGTRINAKDRVTFKPLVAGRVLPFNLFSSLRVSRVQDDQGQELQFIQESKEDDAAFGVIMERPVEVGKIYNITVQYSGGDALQDAGAGNYFLGPRATWYPNNFGTQFGDRAFFDVTYHYRSDFTLVSTGQLEAETKDGDRTVARWTSGKYELAVAGFNYGLLKKSFVVDDQTGYQLEFYANHDLPESIKSRGVGSVTTTGAAPRIIAESQNATRIFTNYFGKMPYQRLALTQQPASSFGQAWPTLIYMPYTAYLDDTQLHFMFGNSSNVFFRYVGAHEISHQWWGHTVGWKSYHDQWMSEGFAEFSTSLYVQFVRGDLTKFHDFWNKQRDMITESRPQTHEKKPYTLGPVTLGYRLNSGKTGNAARFLIYPKGAYILHMLRMMMFDRQNLDKSFSRMMKDFVTTYFNQDASTEDFKRIAEKHMTRKMDVNQNGKLDWFFDEWVYGTELPSYRFDYHINADGSLSGRITQSGVSDNFAMLVPIYVDYGKGWLRLGTSTLVGNSTVEVANVKLAAAPKRAAICALDDVLALRIKNQKSESLIAGR